jgi:hypothetical protein
MSALSIGLEFPIYNSTSSVAVIYPNSATNTLVFISYKEKGSGYYGSSTGLHTVQYTCTPDFVGTVTMHATLATSPSETDWFTVDDTSFSMTQYQAQVQNTSTVTINNFNGNFVWIRGVIEMNDGAVQSILYNR